MLDVRRLRVTRHGSDAVMQVSEKVNRYETTKEVMEVESSSGGNEEDVFGTVGLGGGELGEDCFHRVGNREGEQILSELVFPGDSRPGGSVRRGRRTNMEVVEKEESLKDDSVVQDEGGERRFGLILMISGGGGGGGNLHDIHEDRDLRRKNVDCPIIGRGSLGRRVFLKEGEGISDVLRIFNIFDFKNNGFVLEA